MKALFKFVAVFVVVIALGVGGAVLWFKHAPRKTPSTQPPLAMISAGSLGDLRAAFNAHGEEARILVLLSPT